MRKRKNIKRKRKMTEEGLKDRSLNIKGKRNGRCVVGRYQQMSKCPEFDSSGIVGEKNLKMPGLAHFQE